MSIHKPVRRQLSITEKRERAISSQLAFYRRQAEKKNEHALDIYKIQRKWSTYDNNTPKVLKIFEHTLDANPSATYSHVVDMLYKKASDAISCEHISHTIKSSVVIGLRKCLRVASARYHRTDLETAIDEYNAFITSLGHPY
jgi:hypothetical protein